MKHTLTKEDFLKHPELGVQNVTVGDEVEPGSLLVNDGQAFGSWASASGSSTPPPTGGGNPPPPIPFP